MTKLGYMMISEACSLIQCLKSGFYSGTFFKKHYFYELVQGAWQEGRAWLYLTAAPPPTTSSLSAGTMAAAVVASPAGTTFAPAVGSSRNYLSFFLYVYSRSLGHLTQLDFYMISG
jgi:hypothetical protein